MPIVVKWYALLREQRRTCSPSLPPVCGASQTTAPETTHSSVSLTPHVGALTRSTAHSPAINPHAASAFHRPSAINRHTHTRLMAHCQGLPGWAGTRKVNQSGFYWSKRQWVAVASAGHMQVCTSLQTDNRASNPPLSFFTGHNFNDTIHTYIHTYIAYKFI